MGRPDALAADRWRSWRTPEDGSAGLNLPASDAFRGHGLVSTVAAGRPFIQDRGVRAPGHQRPHQRRFAVGLEPKPELSATSAANEKLAKHRRGSAGGRGAVTTSRRRHCPGRCRRNS